MVILLSHVKQAHSRYFNDQKERSMLRVQSGRDVKIKINDDIGDGNRNRQLQDTIPSRPLQMNMHLNLKKNQLLQK